MQIGGGSRTGDTEWFDVLVARVAIADTMGRCNGHAIYLADARSYYCMGASSHLSHARWDWGKALILTAWGAGVVATIDNILYPMLVGNRLKLHTVPAFIGAIGGVTAFGAAGLILGPAIVSVTLALIKILKKRFSKNVVQLP